MKLLVTGGAGYIGAHTTAVLGAAGHDVAVLDNLSRTDRSVLSGLAQILGRSVPFFDADIRDSKALDRVFTGRDFDAVIHFAALKAVGESVQRPLAFFDNNVSGTISLLEAMHRHGCASIIFSSSCTVYGEPDELPVTEASAIKPASSPYGATKQMCERVLADAAGAGVVRAIALRYFNPIGAHPSGEIGELLVDGPSNLIPYVARAAAGASGPLPIFGTDYETPDGTAIRDYIDIMDLAEAHLSALNRLTTGAGPVFEALNIGTGRGRSVHEVIAAFEATNGVEVPVTLVARRAGDVPEVWADPTRAHALLGWTAKRSLEDSLATAWCWQNNSTSENSGAPIRTGSSR
jgi:UDP-glucose 4-epimerase